MKDNREVFRVTDLPKTGVLTGKFAPLTSGHINYIHLAATQVQKLWVVLSFDQKWLDIQSDYWQSRLTLEKRLNWLKRTFADTPHIEIVYVDETDIPTYPDGASQWSALVRRTLSKAGCTSIDCWFSSEPEYSEWINRYFPEAEHVLIDQDRVGVPISATKVREDPYTFWHYIPSIVRKEVVLKVLIVGLESTGKSTLTKVLAKIFNTAWVEEYGRTFCEEDMAGDEMSLEFDHYALIAAKRFQMEQDELLRANRVLFSDTSAIITQMFCELYEGKRHPLVEEYCHLENYDLVLYLQSDIEWVNDGLRGQSGGVDKLNKNKEVLEQLLFEQKLNPVKVSGSFHERLTSACEVVRNALTTTRN